MAKSLDNEDVTSSKDCIENMLRYMSQMHPVYSCADEIRKRVVVASLPAKTVLVRPGQTPNNLYFLDKGCMASSEDREGKIFYNWLQTERCFVTAARSFYSQSIGSERIECLEACNVVMIDSEDLYYLVERYHDFSVCMFKLLSHISAMMEMKHALRGLPNAESRVRRMAILNTELFQRVPLNIMASYLGMTPETLSRITHKKDVQTLLSQSNDMFDF